MERKKGNTLMEFKYLLATQKRNIDLKREFHRWQFDKKMCLKVLGIAVFMVRGIPLIKDICVVNTQWF